MSKMYACNITSLFAMEKRKNKFEHFFYAIIKLHLVFLIKI